MDEHIEEQEGPKPYAFETLEALIEGEVKPFIAEAANTWAMYDQADVPMSTRGLIAYQMAHMDCGLLPAELRASSLDAVAKLYGQALGLPIPE